MYPTIYDAVKDLFGISIPFLKLLQSFGFFVAISFLACAWVFAKELKRKEKEGKLNPTFRKILKGAKATQSELIGQFIFGFLIGWKFISIFFAGAAFSNDPRAYILSLQGNIYIGIVAGGLMAYLKYRQSEKQKLAEPKEEDEKVSAADHVGNMTLIAAFFGFLGAKIFHILENFGSFLEDPADLLFSFSGLTMYGGLILGSIAVLVYARKQGFNIFHVMDACAPGLFLAYGLGRLGCHVSGDGDWGIVNLHPKPGFLPQWLWAYDYPNNVNNVWNPYVEGTQEYLMTAFGTNWEATHKLVAPVYPTPLYEMIFNVLLFVAFWSIRKRFVTPGLMFATYLMFNGLERFLIEIIRVNNVMFSIGSFPVTQAEIIAFALILTGAIGFIWIKKRNANPLTPQV